MPTAERGRGRILFSVNSAWNVANFRAGLVRALIDAGYDVTVAAPRGAHARQVEALGCRFVDLPMQPHGRSPAADLGVLARYVRLMRAERPVAYLGYTAKPNIYGSIAARICGVPAVNNVAGLGLVFNERGATARVLRRLYAVALRRSARVFFQNPDDLALFARERLVDPARCELLPGSGVDLDRFAPPPPREAAPDPFVFLLVARLLWEKGVAELVEAGRRLRRRRPDVAVRILGFTGPGPAFVQPSNLAAWEAEGAATYLGTADDVRPHLAAADCVVLPSYYPEGTPRALLEAAATGRPIITCDMPGCRDVVEHGGNGFLVPPRDAAALAAAMEAVAALPPPALAAMGRRSREVAAARFDERIVVDRYLRVLGDVAGARA